MFSSSNPHVSSKPVFLLQSQGKGFMQTYWLIGKHGVVGDRQPLEEKQEEMDVMAENPHSEKAS